MAAATSAAANRLPDCLSTACHRLEALGRCQMDIVVYSELIADDDNAALLFPLNALRNAAMLLARTDLIMLADADLLIGGGTAEALSEPDT